MLLLALPTQDPDRLDICLIAGGRIWSRTGIWRRESVDRMRDRLSASYARWEASGQLQVDAAMLDEALILDRWLNKHWGHPAMLWLADRSLPQAQVLTEWIGRAFETDFERWAPQSAPNDEIAYEADSFETRVPEVHDGWMPPHMIEGEIQSIPG